jgi:hypothetical protein
MVIKRSAGLSSRLKVQVYCAHKRKEDHIIGEIDELAILDLAIREASKDKGKSNDSPLQLDYVVTFVQILLLILNLMAALLLDMVAQ